jgi:hypothetical protein
VADYLTARQFSEPVSQHLYGTALRLNTMEEYVLLDQRGTDVPVSRQGESELRSATYPPSYLSYEPVGYEDFPDDTRLIGTAPDGNRPSQRRRNFGNYNGSKLKSMPRQLLTSWILALLSGLWMIFTIIFAFNCSLPKPFATWLLPSRSEDALLILNVCSHATVLLLTALTSGAFEAVRWAHAASKNGIPALTFLGLSRATGLLGVLSLFIGGDKRGFLKRDGEQFWGTQRYYLPEASINERLFLFLLNAIVGIALLSNVSVVPSWRNTESVQFNFSGLGPINATLASEVWPLDYWAWLYSLLSTPNYVINVPPTRCSLATDCQSFYLGGSIYNVDPSKDSFHNHPEATLFIVENSIGYQIDYYPPLSSDNMNGANCGTYETTETALNICIKQSGVDLLAGMYIHPLM